MGLSPLCTCLIWPKETKYSGQNNKTKSSPSTVKGTVKASAPGGQTGDGGRGETARDCYALASVYEGNCGGLQLSLAFFFFF